LIDFQAEAAALRDQLIATRRDFHQHPELGFEEKRTSSIVANELHSLGLTVHTEIGKTGVVGVLCGEHPGPTVMYRCDMDALPITEESEHSYVSRHPGVMHACGHDGHIAMALGIAKLMAARQAELYGNIIFVFQPGEEGRGGALAMIKDGLLDMEPQPDVVLGLHLWNPLPVGTIGVSAGAVMSGSSVFNITIQGRGGHAAMPHTTIDPVACAGQLITALHTLVGRRMNAMDGAVVLSVTGVNTSSFTHNIIPATVELTGTFRSFNAYTSELLEQHIRDVTRSVCESMSCIATTHVRHLTIPVVNNSEVVERATRAFTRVITPEQIDTHPHTMASDDVSYLLDEIPGLYFFLGGANQARGLTYGHHHPRFDFDEDALPLGVALVCSAIGDYLLPRA